MNTSKRSFCEKCLTKCSLNLNDTNIDGCTLQELFMYLLFLTVTTILTTSAKGIDMFYFNDKVSRLFLQRSADKGDMFNLEFNGLVTFDDWWTFVGTTFIEGIDYFKYNSSFSDLAVGRDILLGPPRVRQIRVRNDSCNIAEEFKNMFTICYGQYSVSNEDANEYFGGSHYDQSKLNSYSLVGSVAKYSGGGYIQKLTNDKVENENILEHLKEIIWMDSGTRVVLLEFSTYNANVNLFCSVKLIAEIPATGGIITSSQFQSLKYSPVWVEGEYMLKICFVLFIGLIAYFTIDTIRDIITFGNILSISPFFKLSSIIILLIGYFSIGYIIWHTFYMKSLLKKYSENTDDYLSLDIICYWNLVFIDTIGVCVFLAWIQTFKYINFNNTMLQFSTTLQKCAKEVFGFSIMFSIILIAYAYLAILLFGSSLSNFRNFSSAFLTLIRMVLGDFDYERLEKANRILGPIFFLTFILIVFLILMNMFLAIINETYTDVKSDLESKKETQFEEYIKTFLSKIRDAVLPPKVNRTFEEKQNKKDIESISTNRSKWSNLKPKRSIRNSFITQKDALESVYEILPIQTEDDSLNKRVQSVELKLENLIQRFDLILKLNMSGCNTSNRSI